MFEAGRYVVGQYIDRARTRQTLRLRGLTGADTEAYRTLTGADFGIQDDHGGEAQ
ncbi:MAG: hypothetical protein IKH77_06395 [Clostridia bacterium]|nr:hypothetical protein [Clostridia bacterium]